MIKCIDTSIFILSQSHIHVNSHYRATEVRMITALKSGANKEKRLYFLKGLEVLASNLSSIVDSLSFVLFICSCFFYLIL